MSISSEALNAESKFADEKLTTGRHSGPLNLLYASAVDLRPDPKNARLHSKKQIQQIAKSIQTFGFNVPVLIDGLKNIIAGHGRLLAAKSLGWTEIPTIQLAHLSDAQIKAFRIADNRLTEISTWNDQLLAEQLLELSTLDLNFDLDVVGFEVPEIDIRIEGLKVSTPEQDPLDEIPDLPKTAVTRPADMCILGRHRIFCGSSLEEESYVRLMEDQKADMVFSDPPYNVPIAGTRVRTWCRPTSRIRYGVRGNEFGRIH